MAKLMDIMGLWNRDSSLDFNENDKWEGKLLLEEDGWFEGIVSDINSPYKDDRFIFGVYYPGKFIELLKISPTNVSNPYCFHANRDAKTYDGKFEVIGLFGNMPYGNCSISTQYAEFVRENTSLESTTLKAQIQKYKNEIMDSDNREFYYNTLDMRNSMCKILLANYEGRKLTNDDARNIKNECQPIEDRIESKIAEKMHSIDDIAPYFNDVFTDGSDIIEEAEKIKNRF